MPEAAFAERRFETADQELFANLSGDFNPMHMDAIAARRTQAGAPAVHGVHALLWSLEQLADVLADAPLRSLDADFAQFLLVGELVSLHIVRRSDAECRAELRVGNERVAQYALKLGPLPDAPAAASTGKAIVYAADRRDALPLTEDEFRAASGEVAHAAAGPACHGFPGVCRWIGAERLMSLLALTRLVGMVSPGLHSTFHRLTIGMVQGGSASGWLRFATRPADRRFALVTIDVASDGIVGTVKASRRQPPTEQPGMEALLGHVAPGTFAGHSALVIGGSRGLGEVTAKLLALGGAHVAITYASGRDDAERVAAEIVAHGGDAYSFRYDCLLPASPQLASLRVAPGTIYYFATTPIAGRAATGFAAERFARFARVYVDGFYDLVTSLVSRSPLPLHSFYPSSVFVEDTPRNMAEYAMAKAAGEVLCRDLDRFSGRITVDVERLPRLHTDQTASLIEQDVASPESIMGAIVRRVQERAAAAG